MNRRSFLKGLGALTAAIPFVPKIGGAAGEVEAGGEPSAPMVKSEGSSQIYLGTRPPNTLAREGDIFHNSISGNMFIYDGETWQEVRRA